MDGYDIQAMAFVVPSLVNEWGVSVPSFKLAMIACLIGIALGAVLSGSICRPGRFIISCHNLITGLYLLV